MKKQTILFQKEEKAMILLTWHPNTGVDIREEGAVVKKDEGGRAAMVRM